MLHAAETREVVCKKHLMVCTTRALNDLSIHLLWLFSRWWQRWEVCNLSLHCSARARVLCKEGLQGGSARRAGGEKGYSMILQTTHELQTACLQGSAGVGTANSKACLRAKSAAEFSSKSRLVSALDVDHFLNKSRLVSWLHGEHVLSKSPLVSGLDVDHFLKQITTNILASW